MPILRVMPIVSKFAPKGVTMFITDFDLRMAINERAYWKGCWGSGYSGAKDCAAKCPRFKDCKVYAVYVRLNKRVEDARRELSYV